MPGLPSPRAALAAKAQDAISATPTAGTVSPTPLPAPEGARAAVVPASGPPQSVVTVSGTGFAPGHTLSISYVDAQVAGMSGPQGQTLGSATAGADGRISPVKVTLPAAAAPGGIGMVLLRDAGQTVASALFGVTPLNHPLTLLAGVASAGESAVLTGSGFAPGTAVTVSLLDASGAAVASSGPFTSTTTGAIGPLAITVPMTAAIGLGAIDAVDGSGTVAGAPLTILAPDDDGGAALHVQPIRATLGQSVSLSASGFTPGEPVVLSLQGGQGQFADGAIPFDLPGTAPLVADGSGQVRSSFAVPSVDGLTRVEDTGGSRSPAGNRGSLVTVSLRGSQSGVERSGLLVVSGTRLQVIPAVTVPGHPYLIQGEGFGADEQVIVTSQARDCTACGAGGTVTQVGVTQASDSGALSLYSAAPRPPAGETQHSGASYDLTATGQSTGLAAADRLTVTTAPVLLLQPAVVAPGQGVEVHGAGFAAGSTVTVQVGASSGGALSLPALTAVVDGSGRFVVSFTVPPSVTAGGSGVPVAIGAQDGNGNAASTVLTLAAGPAMIRVLPLSAKPGQALTVRGSGFGSGETVDLYLAVPSAPYTALPQSTVPIVADAGGAFTASYVLPQPFLSGSYLVGATGETSGRSAIYAFVLGEPQIVPRADPTPARRGSPTPTPDCDNTNLGASLVYFPRVEATVQPIAASARPAGARGDALARWDDLVVQNAGAQPAMVTVAYLIYPAAAQLPGHMVAPTSSRAATFTLAPYSVIRRVVADDIGMGRVAAAVVRAAPVATAATGCRAPEAAGELRALLIIHRALVQGNDKQPITQMDGAGTTGSGTEPGGAGSGSPQAVAPGAQDAGPTMHMVLVDGSAASGSAEYLDLFNPQTTAAQIQIHVATVYGSPSTAYTIGLPAFAIGRLDAGGLVAALRTQVCAGTPRDAAQRRDRQAFGCGLAHPDPGISLVLDASTPIVAERELLWGDGGGPARGGFDLQPAATAPLRAGFAAFSSTLGGDTARLTLLNPSACVRGTCRVTDVEVEIYTSPGARVARRIVHLAASHRQEVDLGTLGDRSTYSVAVTASQPVFGELTQAVGGRICGGARSCALRSAGFDEALMPAGGSLSGAVATACRSAKDCGKGALPRIRVFNPSTGRTVVRVLGMSGSGVYYVQSYQVGAMATLEVALPPPNAQGAAPAGAGAARPGLQVQAETPAGVQVQCTASCVAVALEGVPVGLAGVSSQPGVWAAPLQ